MASGALNQNDVQAIVKNFIQTIDSKSLKNLNVKTIKENLTVLSNASKYIIQYYKLSSDLAVKLNVYSAELDAKVISAQKSSAESMGKIMDLVSNMGKTEFPSLKDFRKKIKTLDKEIDEIIWVYFKPGGIINHLNAFSPKTETITDSKGKEKPAENYDPEKSTKYFKTLTDTIFEIIDTTVKTSKKAIANGLIIQIGGAVIYKIFDFYLKLTNSEQLKSIASEESTKVIKAATENIAIITTSILRMLEGINLIVTKINIILLIKSTFAAKLIDPILKNTSIIINKVSEFVQRTQNLKVGNTNRILTTVHNVIVNILGLVGDICLLALAAPVLLVAIPIATISLFLIGEFVKITILILSNISSKRDLVTVRGLVKNLLLIIGMILLMVTMTVVSLVLMAMAAPIIVEAGWGTLIVLGAIAAVIVAVAGLALLINLMFKNAVGRQIEMGLLVIIGLIGIMLLTAAALLILAGIGEEFIDGGKWKNTLIMFSIVAVVTLAIAGLGYLITLMLPGIALFAAGMVLMVISIGSMLLIGVMLKGLAAFEFTQDDRDRIKETTMTIIGAVKDVLDALFNGITSDNTPVRDNSDPFTRFFMNTFKGASFVVEALAASLVLVMSVVSMAMILIIAGELWLLSKIDLSEFENARTNVYNVLSIADDIIGAICGDHSRAPGNAEGQTHGKPKGILGTILHGIKGIIHGVAGAAEALLSFGYIALIMVSIGLVTLIAKNLEYLGNLKLNKGDILISVTNVFDIADDVVERVKKISNEENLKNISKDVRHIETILKNTGDISKKLGKFEPITVTVEMVSDMFDVVDKVLERIKVHENKVEKLVTPAKKITKILKHIKTGVEYVNSISQANTQQFGYATDTYIRFVNNINSLDIEHLQTATNMFGKMAEFSKSIDGNFEGLADTINDKIMPILTQLNDTLEKTGDTVKDINFSGGGGTEGLLSGGPAPAEKTDKGGTAAPKKDNSSALLQIKSSIDNVKNAVNDLAKKFGSDSNTASVYIVD